MKYEELKLEVVALDQRDVLTASAAREVYVPGVKVPGNLVMK